MRRQLPAFSDNLIITFFAIDIPQPGAAPEVILEGRQQTHKGFRLIPQLRFRQIPGTDGNQIPLLYHGTGGNLHENQRLIPDI